MRRRLKIFELADVTDRASDRHQGETVRLSHLPQGLYETVSDIPVCSGELTSTNALICFSSASDLLKRHVAGHDQEGFCKRRSSVLEKHARVSQACKSCAASKLKCDEDKPCQRCREKNIVCEGVHNSTMVAFSTGLPQQRGTTS